MPSLSDHDWIRFGVTQTSGQGAKSQFTRTCAYRAPVVCSEPLPLDLPNPVAVALVLVIDDLGFWATPHKKDCAVWLAM